MIEARGDIKVVKCTTSGAFKAAIQESKGQSIYIAGIESVVNEAMSASVDPASAIMTSISILMIELRKKVEANNKIRGGVSPMLPWTRFNGRVRDKVDEAMRDARAAHKEMIYFAGPCESLLRIQKKDGVHLTDQSADLYADYIVTEINKMMEESLGGRKRKAASETTRSARLRMDDDAAEATEGETSGGDGEDEDGEVVEFRNQERRGQPVQPAQPRTVSVARELHERISALEEKSFQDNLMFARQQEELDTIANEKSEDRVIFTGVFIEGFFRLPNDEKIQRMRIQAQNLVDRVMGNEEARIEYVNQVNKAAKSGPVTMNARFNSRDAAKQFRAKFARTMKEHNKDGTMPNEFRGINVLPAQRLSTRVRIDILRSIADYISEETDANVKAYVIAHIPRPILKVEIFKGGSTYIRSLNFTEAIEYTRIHHDRSLRCLQLHQAYARAGSAFKGNIQQYFVVLK